MTRACFIPENKDNYYLKGLLDKLLLELRENSKWGLRDSFYGPYFRPIAKGYNCIVLVLACVKY